MHITLTRYVFALTAILRTLNLLTNIKDTKYKKHKKYRQGPISPTSGATFPVMSHAIVNMVNNTTKPQNFQERQKRRDRFLARCNGI